VCFQQGGWILENTRFFQSVCAVHRFCVEGRRVRLLHAALWGSPFVCICVLGVRQYSPEKMEVKQIQTFFCHLKISP
jgi:hypothetical protein